MVDILLLWSFIGYGMTTIIVYGSIFDSTRQWILKHSKFFGELINCPLCTSTWVGFFLSIVTGGLTIQYFEVGWLTIFLDGMFTAGAVWAINSIIEFFEESRIK
jgi:hypothetical protein